MENDASGVNEARLLAELCAGSKHRYRHSVIGLACLSNTAQENTVSCNEASTQLSAAGDSNREPVTVAATSTETSTKTPQAAPKKPEAALTGKKVEGTASSDGHQKPRVILASNMEPTYYIGGCNGNAMIEDALSELGWKRTKDKLDENYRLKWCELKGNINYNTFREGDQMVNHIPNCHLLTNKMGLLNSLQEYDRVCVNVKNKASKLDFIPETYKLDESKERESFLETFKEGELWICKPTGRNQGKGIFLVRDLEELRGIIAENEAVNATLKAQGKPKKSLNRIIQRYIGNPLLLDGRKFDIRAYMFIASTVPYLVLYHKGYVRLCVQKYEEESENLTAHLTNQFIQKKDPNYKDSKEETVWSMDRFNDHINEKFAEEKVLDKDWVYSTLTNRMKQIMTFCFNAVKGRLQCKTGYFDLYGLDFMVDQDMKIWLIEVNVNPSLATNCEALRGVVPSIVKETLRVAVECFEKSRKSRPLMPLQSLNGFQILYNGSPRTSGPSRQRSMTGTPSKSSSPVTHHSSTLPMDNNSKTLSPVRRTRSLSPVKETAEASTTKYKTGVISRQMTKATPTTTQGLNRSLDRSIPSLGQRHQSVIGQSNSGTGIKSTRERSHGKPVPFRSPAPFKERNPHKVASDPQNTSSKSSSSDRATSTKTADKKTKGATPNPTVEEENTSANNNIASDHSHCKRSGYFDYVPPEPSKISKNAVTLKMTHGKPVVPKDSKPVETKCRGS